MGVFKNIKGNIRNSGETVSTFKLYENTGTGTSLIQSDYDTSKSGPVIKKLVAGSGISFSPNEDNLELSAYLPSSYYYNKYHFYLGISGRIENLDNYYNDLGTMWNYINSNYIDYSDCNITIEIETNNIESLNLTSADNICNNNNTSFHFIVHSGSELNLDIASLSIPRIEISGGGTVNIDGNIDVATGIINELVITCNIGSVEVRFDNNVVGNFISIDNDINDNITIVGIGSTYEPYVNIDCNLINYLATNNINLLIESKQLQIVDITNSQGHISADEIYSMYVQDLTKKLHIDDTFFYNPVDNPNVTMDNCGDYLLFFHNCQFKTGTLNNGYPNILFDNDNQSFVMNNCVLESRSNYDNLYIGSFTNISVKFYYCLGNKRLPTALIDVMDGLIPYTYNYDDLIEIG